jgi:large subunit ribosomal protein L25
MAIQSAQVTAKRRAELGSRRNQKLRDAGLLPGVIYGHKEEVVPVTLTHKEVVGHLNRGAHLFNLQLDGQNENCLIKDVQYDHLGTNIIHVDFARVRLDEKVKVTVPLELKGVPKGEADGGVLQQILVQLEIECLVMEIPDAIRHNVSEMALNTVLHLKDLHLPAGVRLIADGELIAATVKEIVEVAAETPVAVAGGTEPEVIGRKAEDAAEGDAKGADAKAGDAKKGEPKK